MSLEISLARLSLTDWNFSDVPANTGLHAIHPYPAKFIPQIPRKLIELYHPGDSSLILDPFCGSGTTLVEAIRMGLSTVGVDLNPLACQITRVKTTPLRDDLEEIGKRVSERAKAALARGKVRVPEIPRLDHWFESGVQISLAALTQSIGKIDELPVREALQIALSSIIVKLSNQESDTRYAAVKKNVSIEDVFSSFRRAVGTVRRGVSSLSDNLFGCLGKASVLNRDVLALSPRELPAPIGLVITSPPYPNAYEYWLYHKYRMYWLGMDPIEVRKNEIGARPHYFKSNAQNEHDFERQMSVCFNLLSKIMLPKSKACFLVGRSIIHGRIIDNVALLERAAKPYGFLLDDIALRNIPSNRKTFNPANSRIQQEHVMVFNLAD